MAIKKIQLDNFHTLMRDLITSFIVLLLFYFKFCFFVILFRIFNVLFSYHMPIFLSCLAGSLLYYLIYILLSSLVSTLLFCFMPVLLSFVCILIIELPFFILVSYFKMLNFLSSCLEILIVLLFSSISTLTTKFLTILFFFLYLFQL